MRKMLLLIFTFLIIHISSQVRTYEFSFCGREQKVKLIEKRGRNYRGIIESNFHKNISGREINKVHKINRNTVRKIIEELHNSNIYSLKDSDDKADCGDFYLDGDYFSVFIFNEEDKTSFNKTFAEIYPESESKIIEENSCRREAQVIATIIDKYLNLKQIHLQHFKKLGYGTCYWTGISQVCKLKKKK